MWISKITGPKLKPPRISESQHTGLASRIHQLQQEISDLAFTNYRTYADVGRTAENCKEMLTQVSQQMSSAKRGLPSLVDTIQQFSSSADQLREEYDKLEALESEDSQLWELLQLPQRMDKCIRAGRYEEAYSLTSFALRIQQQGRVGGGGVLKF